MINFSFGNIYTFILIIIFCPMIGKLINRFVSFYKLSNQYRKGNTLLGILSRITPKEFQIWCSEYICYLGYSNILLSTINSNEFKDSSFFICTKGTTTYYVECKRINNNPPITSTDLECLLGSLFSKSLFNGILVTTSSISKEATNFINSLPKKYSIEVVSLCDNEAELLENTHLQIN